MILMTEKRYEISISFLESKGIDVLGCLSGRVTGLELASFWSYVFCSGIDVPVGVAFGEAVSEA